MSKFADEEVKTINEFLLFVEKPERLYCNPPYMRKLVNHYTSSQGLLGILKNQNLRFTEYSYLNDNTEGDFIFVVLEDCLYGDTYIDKEFKKAILCQLDNSPFNEIFDLNCKHYFLCCFSSNSDSLPMWNYYSKMPSKVGYNIQFRYEELFQDIGDACEKNDGLYFEGYKVMYSKEEQYKFLHNCLDYVYRIWRESCNDFIIRVFLNYLNSVRFAFKHFAFEPEQELRFVIKVDDKEYQSALQTENDLSKLINFNDREGVLVPYLEIPFSNNSVNSIKLSPLIKEENAKESVRLLLNKLGYNRKVQIESSDIPLRY